MELGSYGVWMSRFVVGDGVATVAELAERLGFGAAWLGTSVSLRATEPLLARTRSVVIGTAVMNVWSHRDDTDRLAQEYHRLTTAHGDRLVLGFGVANPETVALYRRPLSTMVEFLDGLDSGDRPVPVDRRVVGALGPVMSTIAAARSAGPISFLMPAAHIADIRQRIGPEPRMVSHLMAVIDPDADRARVTARSTAAHYLRLSNLQREYRRLGYGDADFEEGGSDRLIDDVVACGTPEHIVERIEAHRAAGADHVCIGIGGVAGVPEAQLSILAEALELEAR